MSIIHTSEKYTLLWVICVALLPGCAPANALPDTSEAANIAAPVLESASPTRMLEPEGCTAVHSIMLCVQDVKRLKTETRVTIKVLGGPNLLGVDILADDQNRFSTVLLDDQGHSYSLVENDGFGYYDDGRQPYYKFSFQAVPADAKKLTISLPIVQIDSRSTAKGFQLDLGENPQPGQTRQLDSMVTVEGQIFHFVKAEFTGDGVGSLPMILSTDPLNLPDDIFSITPMLGDREQGIFFGGKTGLAGKPLQLSADLVLPPGKSSGLTHNTHISGILNLNVYEIIASFRGPFEIQVTLP